MPQGDRVKGRRGKKRGKGEREINPELVIKGKERVARLGHNAFCEQKAAEKREIRNFP